MKNIVTETKHSYSLFKNYYQNLRNVLITDANGKMWDPFGNEIVSLTMDKFGNIEGLYVKPPYGYSSVVLYGNPDSRFHIQGNRDDDMYAYTFHNGTLMEERQSNQTGYIHRLYSKASQGRPVMQNHIPHIGTSEEKLWTEDGKTLVHKKTRTMDEDCLEKIVTEFVDKKGQHCLRIDWRQYGRDCLTQLYDLSLKGNKLKWLCEKDHKGNYCFYNGQGRLVNVVTNNNGKRQRIPVVSQPNQTTR